LMTYSATPPIQDQKHHAVTRVAMAIVLWSIAASLVALTHQQLDAMSPLDSIVVEVGAILAMAAAYIRVAAPEATLDHALFVGTTWVLLAIAAEIGMTATSG